MKSSRSRDRVSVRGLQVHAGIGVYAHEQSTSQRLEFDLSLRTDTSAAAAADDLALAVDYDAIADTVRTVAASRHHQLLESLAERVAEALFARLGERVDSVKIRVSKPGAVADAATVQVTIVRDRVKRPR